MFGRRVYKKFILLVTFTRQMENVVRFFLANRART